MCTSLLRVLVVIVEFQSKYTGYGETYVKETSILPNKGKPPCGMSGLKVDDPPYNIKTWLGI